MNFFNKINFMQKPRILIAVLIISTIAIVTHNYPCHAQAQGLSSNENELSITLLHPYIEKGITDFYGYSRRYEIGDSQIEILDRNGNIFSVKVVVDTFEGPHNDYYTEILIFTVTPCSVTLEKYTHSEFIPKQ